MSAMQITLGDWEQSLFEHLHTGPRSYLVSVVATKVGGSKYRYSHEVVGITLFDAVSSAALEWQRVFIFGCGSELSDPSSFTEMTVSITLKP